MTNKSVIVVVGPTASGKTKLAVELAKEFNGEIISADSMQIYKGMDIATAKPTTEEMEGITHHLIDFLDPSETFSVAKYKKITLEKIEEIQKKNKTVIIVGGTGLYIDAVVNNTVFYDYEETEIRQKLEEQASKDGIEILFEKLKEIDPDCASKLNLNDKKRIIRALEIYYLTGKTLTQQNKDSHTEKSKYDFLILGLNAKDRQFLYDRINKRVDIMLENGLIKEAELFFKSSFSSTAKQAIGYKELQPFFENLCTLDCAVKNLKMATRRYAKRQLTWFRRNEKIHWLYIDECDNLKQQAINIIKQEVGE